MSRLNERKQVQCYNNFITTQYDSDNTQTTFERDMRIISNHVDDNVIMLRNYSRQECCIHMVQRLNFSLLRPLGLLVYCVRQVRPPIASVRLDRLLRQLGQIAYCVRNRNVAISVQRIRRVATDQYLNAYATR